MGTILFIIISFVAIALIAYLVANYIPQKYHWIISVFSLLVVIFLSYKIYESIYKPIAFNSEKKERYSTIIGKLKMIRDAQVLYKKATGKFTDDSKLLLSFIDTAKIPITKIILETKDDLGNDQIKTKAVIDTLGYNAVKESFIGRNYQEMFKNKFSDQDLSVKVAEIIKNDSVSAPVFEVKVPKSAILKGLNKKLISEEERAVGGKEITGSSLRVGSLNKLSIEGNWPDFYDYK